MQKPPEHQKIRPATAPPPPPLWTLPPPLNPKPIPPNRRHTGCCLRCVCWSFCVVILMIAIVAGAATALYLVYKPKLPNFSVDRLSVTAFNLDPTFQLQTTFSVTATATNPNDRIAIHYVENGHLSVWYNDTRLCEGRLPAFYQGYRNTTVLHVRLRGRTQIGSAVVIALQAAQRMGEVPLVLDGIVPVRVKVGGVELWKVKVVVRCGLVVDSLSANSRITVRKNDCKFKFRL